MGKAMKVLFAVDLRAVVMALRRAGYSPGRDSRCFRKEKFHVILVEIPNGVILELHSDRERADLKREMARIRTSLQGVLK